MLVRLISITTFLLLLLSIPVLSVDDNQEVSVKYAEVTSPRVSISKEVAPKSELVQVAREGQIFEIVSEGKLWVEVKTETGNGWIPVSACRIIDRKTPSLLSNPANTIAFVAVILIGLGISIFFIVRRKEDEEAF